MKIYEKLDILYIYMDYSINLSFSRNKKKVN